MICPHCKQEAPTVVRGLRAYCTACGAPRSLLGDTPVNVAGQPAKVGGGIAGVLGWITLIFGSLTALALGALLQAIWTASIVGYIFGGFLGTVSLLVGLGLIFGGRKLQQSGNLRSQSAREQAVFALAQRHEGSVTAADLARSLSISEQEADALLTEMAKRPDGRVTLEVDEDGTLRYFVTALADGRWRRVDGSTRLRVPGGGRISEGAPDEASEEAADERDEGASRQRSRW